MDKYTALDDLNHLFGTYVDVELENFALSTDRLKQGFTIGDLRPLSKSAKLINLIKQQGFKDQQIHYYKSYHFQHTGRLSLSEIRKPRISLFFDDLWEVKITHPTEYEVTSFFTGQYLFDTLRQGLCGLIPQMIKERTGKSITHPDFKDKTFNLEITLCTDHEKYVTSNRGRIIQSIDFVSSDAEVYAKIKPENLFHSILNYKNDSKNALFKERLKLWNITYPANVRKASQEDLLAFVKNLPINDFGVKDLLKINNIILNFHNTLDNEMLLKGAVGVNAFERRHIDGFNKKLKNLLKT